MADSEYALEQYLLQTYGNRAFLQGERNRWLLQKYRQATDYAYIAIIGTSAELNIND